MKMKMLLIVNEAPCNYYEQGIAIREGQSLLDDLKLAQIINASMCFFLLTCGFFQTYFKSECVLVRIHFSCVSQATKPSSSINNIEVIYVLLPSFVSRTRAVWPLSSLVIKGLGFFHFAAIL